MSFLKSISQKYDMSVMLALSIVYFNQGFKVFLDLAILDYFKSYLQLEPTMVQYISSIVVLPWTLKIVYGLIADNFPLFGSRRRNYIVLNGCLQFLTLFVLSFDLFSSPLFITVMLFFNALSSAFVDVVVDALMVTQSRVDPDHGSDELQGLSWCMLSIGGIIGSLLSAMYTSQLHPRYAFLTCSLIGLIMIAVGLNMDIAIEEGHTR